MSFRDLADDFRRIAAELPENLMLAEAATLSEAQRLAEEASSGDLSPADLRRADHPYAKRHGSPRRDPRVVNEQSGDFKRAWETEGPQLSRGALTSSLFNTDPKAAEFLEPGTDRMFAREPHELVADAIEESRRDRLEAAIERTLGG